MRRTTVSTQAMVELQHMLNSLGGWLTLHRTGKYWELWFVGDDFGLTDAQKAELAESDDYYYSSHQYVSIKITRQGQIREFTAPSGRYSGRSVFHQFILLIEAIEIPDGTVHHLRIEVRPSGQLIDIDVIAVEDIGGSIGGDDMYVPQLDERIVGRFAYDSIQKLIVHRAK